VRPIHPFDLVLTADEYLGLVVEIIGDRALVLIGNGLFLNEPLGSIRAVPFSVEVDSPANFAEAFKAPLAPRIQRPSLHRP
jgi:hypothetical protein